MGPGYTFRAKVLGGRGFWSGWMDLLDRLVLLVLLGFLVLLSQGGADEVVEGWSGASAGAVEGCGGGEGSVGGVVGDLFDGGVELGGGGACGQVERGDLESIEEQADASRLEFGLGELAEDDADGGLDGAAVFGQGEGEASVGGFSAAWAGGGGALVSALGPGGVVVEAELLVAQTGGAAAVAVGEDVSALEAGRSIDGCDFRHGSLHL